MMFEGEIQLGLPIVNFKKRLSTRIIAGVSNSADH